MSEPIHDTHPMKVHVDSFGADGTLKAEDGWVDMNVKFLITRDSVNAQQTVFGITVFPPGAKHDIHRHPHAEETEYIVEGHGVARVGDDDVAMGPGDIVFVPTDAYHGFYNTSETERAVMVWCYGGAGTLAEAGYVREGAEPGESELSMRAVVFHGPKDVRVESVPEPSSPGPGEVLVQPLWCGICGTDLHEYTSGPIVTPAKPHPLTGVTIPQIFGHEFSASVAAIGEGVSSVREGDRVSIMPLIFCGRCDMCRLGKHHMCRIMACTGLSSSSGGLSEFALVKEYQVARLPDEVTDIQGAAIEPAVVAMYGVERARFPGGGRVLITGSGPIGALSALAAAALGAGEVIISEPNPNRSAFAAGLGVGPVLTETGEALAERLRDLTQGEGVDAAIECAGKEAAFNTCIDAVKPQGSVIQVGLHVAPATTFPEKWSMKDLRIEGTWCYNVTDWPRVIRLVAAGKFPVEKIITSQLPLDSIVSGGFERLIDPTGREVKVLGSAAG